MAHITGMMQMDALPHELRETARDLSLRVAGGVQRKSALVLLGEFQRGAERKNRQLTRLSGIKVGCQGFDHLVAVAPEHLGVVRVDAHTPLW